MDFELVSAYQPTGDQPEAIRQLVEGVNAGITFQTLLGVTGSGKTFTMANVIEQVKKPTLILSHNKTLAAQLYAEFKQFFPHNAVEYFVSYYDYYQPEAYIPVTNTYIEKDLSINDEIENFIEKSTLLRNILHECKKLGEKTLNQTLFAGFKRFRKMEVIDQSYCWLPTW